MAHDTLVVNQHQQARDFYGGVCVSQQEILLEATGIVKDYPGVRALDRVDLTLMKGEVHVLVGENGAGKSTLVKVVSGATVPDQIDRVSFDGKPLRIGHPKESLDAGIAVIYQHFSLVPQMTVAENIFLGREIESSGRLNVAEMQRNARALLDELGIDLDPRVRVETLGAGDQQIVEICKAISVDPKLLVMDEPTSGLKFAEIQRLFEIIARLKAKGITILYISHRLEEIFQVGDRVTCLRNGKKVHEGPLHELDHAGLTRLIIGRELEEKFPKLEVPIGDAVLRVKSLQNSVSRVLLRDVSFEVREGEILGVYGILGSGKDELANTLFGVTPAVGGSIEYKGQPCTIHGPRDAIANRIGYLTDDRRRDGLVSVMSVKNNLTLAALKQFTRLYLRDSLQEAEARQYIDKLRIVTPHTETLAESLSGGNQQKVVLGKWLISQADVLLLNELTKGIDVGSKVEVFRLVVEQVEQRKAVVLLTSELEEAMGMADRILVMRNGRIVGEFERKQWLSGEVTKDELLRVATAKEQDAA